MKDFFRASFSILAIIIFIILQLSLLQPTSGQAMSMAAFYIFYTAVIGLPIAYIVFVFCNWSSQVNYWKYLALVSQVIMICYSLYKYRFFYNYENNWTRDERDIVGVIYTPQSEFYVIIFIFSIALLSYCIGSIWRKKNKNIQAPD